MMASSSEGMTSHDVMSTRHDMSSHDDMSSCDGMSLHDDMSSSDDMSSHDVMSSHGFRRPRGALIECQFCPVCKPGLLTKKGPPQ